MQKPIIIKNTLNEVVYITDLSNQYIAELDTFELSDYYDVTEINGSQSLKDLINNGTFIINDGTNDLSIEDALEHTKDVTNFEIIKNLSDLPEVPPIESGKVLQGVDSTSVIWVEKSNSEGYLHFGISSAQYLSDGIIPAIALNEDGYTMPKDGTIESLGVITDESNNHTFEILKNNSVVSSLVFSDNVQKSSSDLNISFVKDDIINLKSITNNSSVSNINNVYTPDVNTLWLAHIDGDNEDLRHITNSSTIAKGMSGRVIGATLNSTGIFDKCISFDGSNYVELLHHDNYNTLDSTIEFFFNANSLSDWQCLFSKEDTIEGIWIGMDSNNIYSYVDDDENTDTTSLSTDTWYHLAIVMGTGGLKIFLNGIMIHTDATTGGLNGNVELMALGASLENNDADYYKNLDYHFNGKIDELRISNNRRYESNFTTPTAEFTTDANTVGLWHFNEISGFLVYDESDTIQNAMCMADGSMLQIKDDHKVFGTHSLKLNDSRDDWIRSNHLPEYESLTITVEGWIRAHHDKDTGIVFQKGDINTEGGLNVMWSKHLKRLETTYAGASTTRLLHTNADSFKKDQWHHFAVTLLSDRIEILVDGAIQDYEDLTTDYQNVWLNNKSDIYWGRNGTSPTYYGQVYLDELRISNIIRTYSGTISGIKQVTAIVGVK